MFSVVICTMNNCDLLVQHLRRVIESPFVGQCIIVNNNSIDATQSYLEGLAINSKLIVINNIRNNGVIIARNQGLAVADQQHTIVLDDDQIISDSTFEQYTEALGKYDIVGYEPQIMDFKTGLTHVGTKTNFTYVGAGGMAMKTSLWRKLKFFDEVFAPAFFEDPDLCIRAKKLGKILAIVNNHGIRHLNHMTLNNKRNDLGYSMDNICVRNRKIFLHKYGDKEVKENKVVLPVAFNESEVRVLIVTPNTQIGGVQQHPVALIKGSENKNIKYMVYSLNPGHGGLHNDLSSLADISYPTSKEYYTKIFWRNVSHRIQILNGPGGRKYEVKPGGDIDESECPIAATVSSFHKIKKEMPKPHATLRDTIREFKPHILHTETDRRSMLTFMKGLKNRDFKLVRTFHTPIVEKKRMHNNYDGIVVITNNAYKKYKNINKRMMCTQIYNGIDVGLFKPMDVDRSEKLVLIHTRLAKVFKLTTEPKLFFKVARKVTSRHPDVKFVILASQIQLVYNEVVDLIKKNGVWDNCIIIPALSGVELVKYINKAWVWFYPMNVDNFPFSVLEAMACGVPIVSSNIVGLSEMMKHNKHGLLCKPGDINTYVSNICKLLDNREEANRLGVNARKRAVDTFSIKTMTMHYENLYLALLGRK